MDVKLDKYNPISVGAVAVAAAVYTPRRRRWRFPPEGIIEDAIGGG